MAGDRVFLVSLGVSILLHLSMVTFFSIVIPFPHQDLDYYTFEIIDPRTRRPLLPAERQLLRLPSIEEALARSEAEAIEAARFGDAFAGGLPEIELPRLEFAGLERLRIREKSLEVRARYSDLLSPRPRDSWARFGEELGRIGDALSRLSLAGWLEREDETQPQVVSRPAPGFEAYIEWMSEPRDRQLILAPPIEALWGVDAREFDQPASLVFRVDPQGKVVEVLTLLEDDAGLLAGMGRALLQYRFEPLDPQMAHNQYGTWIVSRAGAEP